MASAKFPDMGTNDHELSKLDTIGLASKIREGEISPAEAVQVKLFKLRSIELKLSMVN